MNRVEVKAGDVYFIPAGTIHALGSGVNVLEIQQTSDITYRIYDWNRTDEQGIARELHTALAVDAIDFSSDAASCHKHYTLQTNRAVSMVDCPYFTTNIISLEGKATFDYASLDSFVLYICAEGEADIKVGDTTEHITPYELVMIPAEADMVTLSGEAKLLEVYIK
jgi:mannose-6-phosphate isomerase